MTALQIASVFIAAPAYIVLHWCLSLSLKRFRHWTLGDSLDTAFRTRYELRRFWTKMAVGMLIADLVIALTVIWTDWHLIAVCIVFFTIYKISILEIFHRS